MSTTTQAELTACQKALTDNGFRAFIAADIAEAKSLFFTQILPVIKVASASWGDSLTLLKTGILDELSEQNGIELIKTFEEGVDRHELLERRRQALLCDLFLTGSNAVTKDGKIINLDMIGNRTAPICFGPKQVVLFIGRNKITDDLVSAMARVKAMAAPRNAQRHNMATPCNKTGYCHDCSSPERICNSWSIITNCYPPGRIKVILIDADLGL